MTREEKIRQASIEYTYRNTPMCRCGGVFSEMVDELNRNKSFEEGAKLADAHQDSAKVYTKQELLDMGFAFDLNGNIRTPDECYESSVRHLEYRKQKFIDKACEWLEQHHEDYYQYDAWGGECVNLTTLIQDFKKAMGSDETSTL